MTTKEKTEIELLEEVLSLPNGFYERLKEDDGWSFIIKLHSMIEASLTHLLSKNLETAFSTYIPSGDIEYENLSKVFSIIDTSDKKKGKIVLTRVLGITTKNQRRFVSALSEIRNLIILDVRNVSFKIDEYLASLTAPKLDEYSNLLSSGMRDEIEYGGKLISRQEYFLKDPKYVIWLCFLFNLKELYYACEYFDKHKETIDLKEKLAEHASTMFEIIKIRDSVE